LELPGFRGVLAVQSEGVTIMKPVRVYERETRIVVERFVGRKLSFPQCIAALDAALARAVPRLDDGHLTSVRALMLANSEAVTRETQRRGPMERAAK
jgi:hypothetical protein